VLQSAVILAQAVDYSGVRKNWQGDKFTTVREGKLFF